MKKKMIVGIAMAMGMLSVGAISASAAASCCNDGKCADKQVVQKFTQETAALSSALKAKDIELREQNSYDGINMNKVNDLEAELKELKGKIRVVAEKYGLPSCCLS
jgi:peptidoglycan hydrolase CwlO-like protein